jgi:hypothetical protein
MRFHITFRVADVPEPSQTWLGEGMCLGGIIYSYQTYTTNLRYKHVPCPKQLRAKANGNILLGEVYHSLENLVLGKNA